jgi:hypothetical protein
MNPSFRSLVYPRAACVLAALLLSAVSLKAAVPPDPALSTGANSIDPSGGLGITTNASGSTAKSTLEGLSGFGVVQNFTGAAAGTNVLSFSDASTADVKISFSGTDLAPSTGNHSTSSSFFTSAGSGMFISSNNNAGGGSIITTIDFGSWNGSTFDSSVNAVSAAAFTLSGPTSRFARVTSISASFLSNAGTELSVQTVTPSYGTNPGLYFGYQAEAGQSIGSIVLTVNVSSFTSGDTQVILGLDDLGFAAAAIPEPSTATLGMGAAAMMGALVLKRRK